MKRWHQIHSTVLPTSGAPRINDIAEVNSRILTVSSFGYVRVATKTGLGYHVEEVQIRDEHGRAMHLRCVAISPSGQRGFIGVLTPSGDAPFPRLLRMGNDAMTWNVVSDEQLPSDPPAGVCGLCFPSNNAAFAVGTYRWDSNPGAWRCEIDGDKEHWRALPIREQLPDIKQLVDVYFWNEEHGIVVGGRFDAVIDAFIPAIARTRDGGETWSFDNFHFDAATLRRNRPRGQYAWKIFPLNESHTFVSLASYSWNGLDDAVVLQKIADDDWRPLTIPSVSTGGNNLHGVGFARSGESVLGWACVHGKKAAETLDGGATWKSSEDLPDINRFRVLDGRLYAAGTGLYYFA